MMYSFKKRIYRLIKKIFFFKRNRKLKFYNQLCTQIVADVTVKVDEFNGDFRMNVNSDIFKRIFMKKAYESEFLEVIEKFIHENSCVVDIGANIGLYTVFFGKKCKQVLAVEPTSSALELLYSNLKLNNLNNVTVHEGVILDKKKQVELKFLSGKEEYTTVGEWNHPSVSDKNYELCIAEAVTLDDLLAKHEFVPDFIKMDVEGVEHLVLKGSEKVLNDFRPVIFTELSNYLLKKNNSSAKYVMDRFWQHDYRVLNPETMKDASKTKAFGNILCIPREKQTKFM